MATRDKTSPSQQVEETFEELKEARIERRRIREEFDSACQKEMEAEKAFGLAMDSFHKETR